MKTLILLPLAALLFVGCESPQPVVVERHHHHYTTRPAPSRRPAPAKAAPSVSSESATGFRAIEKAD